MNALLLETSSEKGLIALSIDGKPAAMQALPGGPALSKTLASEVSALLGPFKPSYVAIGAGPGSYTGIRVGAALAKSLAFGWGVPLIGFCSLSAFQAKEASGVLVDARMGGFYALKNGSPLLLSPQDAQELFAQDSCLASPHPALIQKRLSLSAAWIETNPDPETIAALAHQAFLSGQTGSLNLSYLSSP